MRVFREILCPVDTSTSSQRALRYAVALGKWYDAEVVGLFVRPTFLPPVFSRAHQPAEAQDRRGDPVVAVESLIEFVQGVVGAAPVRTMVREGRVAPEILRVAHELPADLIVMGTHGLSGFDRLLLGSVTEKVLRKAECPVLTIPERAGGTGESPDITFGTIVCGVDRSPASRSALESALSLAQQAGGRLVLAHVFEDLADEEPRFAGHFNSAECWRAIEPEIRADYDALVPDEARRWCQIELRSSRGRAYRELSTIATDAGADLIVVGTGGWHTPIGATTQHVVRAAECPVLVVPPDSTGVGRRNAS